MNLLSTLMFFGPIGIGELVVIFLMSLILILPLICLIDILKSKFEQNNKLIWVLVILFLNIIGALLYFFIGRKQKIN